MQRRSLRRRKLLWVALVGCVSAVLFVDTNYQITEPGRAVDPDSEIAAAPEDEDAGVSILTVRHTSMTVGEFLLRGLSPNGEPMTPLVDDGEVELAGDGEETMATSDFQFISSQWDGWNAAQTIVEDKRRRLAGRDPYLLYGALDGHMTTDEAGSESLIVTSVPVSSPASDLLYSGDRIVSIDGHDVSRPNLRVVWPAGDHTSALTVSSEYLGEGVWQLQPSVAGKNSVFTQIHLEVTPSYTLTVAEDNVVGSIPSRESERVAEPKPTHRFGYKAGRDCCSTLTVETSQQPSVQRFREIVDGTDSGVMTFQVLRLGNPLEVRVDLDDRLHTDGLGISVAAVEDWGEPHSWSDQLDNISGPSGGLSLALWYLDQSSPSVSLFGELNVAATGRVLPNGEIRSVGAVEEKMELVASEGDFAVVFVPASNYSRAVEAADVAGVTAAVVPVRAVTDALTWLCDNGSRVACGFSED